MKRGGPVLIAGAVGSLAAATMLWPHTQPSLGTFTTSLQGRTPGQARNARLALRAINGSVIQPGGTFSFNRLVGGWTRDKGYVKAPVSYNGQLLSDWGGGVCQVSTTLYNAGLRAGLEVVERHRHTFAPSYVPPGLDAAVAYENIDLKLRNPYSKPVRVNASVEGDRIVVTLDGGDAGKDRPTVRPQILAASAPAQVTFGAGSHGRVRNSGKSGYEVVVWREWANRREFISHDHYPVMHRIIQRTD